jgi:hypothetical protein
MEQAWQFARMITPEVPQRSRHRIGIGCNLLVTISPRAVNELPRTERTNFWARMRNKIAEFARYHGFEHMCVWSRESAPWSRQRELPVANGEHMHMLTYIPPTLVEQFKKTGKKKWAKYPDEFDVTSATYEVRRTSNGRWRSARTYLTKNSPQAFRFKAESWKEGGPIHGKRNGWSTNLGRSARLRYEVQQRALKAQAIQPSGNGMRASALNQGPLF